MSIIMFLFKFISFAISIYELMCVTRIILTWFPGMNRTRFYGFLSAFCDPFLNWFRRFNLRAGNLDFSPLLAIGTLILAGSLANQISSYGRLFIGGILASLVQVCWSIAASLISLFNVILAIRLIVHLFGKDFSSSIWRQLDSVIYPVNSRITQLLFRNRRTTYRLQLAVTLAICIFAEITGSMFFGGLATTLAKLPF